MESIDDLDRSCEPMDIDLSTNNSAHRMDISFSDFPIETSDIKPERDGSGLLGKSASVNLDENKSMTSHIKKYHININRQQNTSIVPKKIIISIILATGLSILCYNFFIIECGELNIAYLSKSLTERVYGQSKAVKDILKTFESESLNSLLLFTGGTGVGKTFTASIILESAGYSSNVYHYTMPSFVNTISTDLMIGMTLCKTSIIIVDDLNIDDTRAKTHIKDIIMKSEHLGKNITVVLIYNCDQSVDGFSQRCDDHFYMDLLEMYRDVPVLKKLIKFEPLKEEHLIKCIEHELGRKLAHKTDYLKNFNVSLDGCKGVHTRMKIMNNL